MSLPIIIIIALVMGLATYFFKKFNSVKADTIAANESFETSKFWAENALDLALSVLILGALIFGVDTSNLIANADVTNLTGAFVTGMGIPAAVVTLLSLVKVGDKSRRNLRKVVDSKTNKLDELLDNKK